MTETPIDVTRLRRPAEKKIRVLIVDDSLVMRHLILQALQGAPEIEVVGSEADGIDALARIPSAEPDLVTLDIEMPRMDGLETLRHIRSTYPRIRTLMFSTLTTRGASATFEALSLGADDYVAKAANAGSLDKSLLALREELIPKIVQLFRRRTAYKPAAEHKTSAPPVRRSSKFKVVGIGVSTGGPQALAEMVPKIPNHFPLPILIVQHMPVMFTNLLAQRLSVQSGHKVEEAQDGMIIAPGTILIAPGDHHMRVTRQSDHRVIALDQGPRVNFCRPAVDVLFESLRQAYGGDVLSIVMTGMGNDGLRGTEILKQAGAYSVVQDEPSSVVWGMPGAIAQAGLADRIVPLSEIASEIMRLTQ